MATHLYQLIDARLDGGIDRFVEAGLSAQKGWRKLAEEISEATGCEVSFETLRGWYRDRITIEVKVA